MSSRPIKAPRKILHRLVSAYAFSLFISTLIVGVTVYYLFAKSLRESDQADILVRERAYTDVYSKNGLPGLSDFLLERSKLEEKDNLHIAILSNDGIEIYRYIPPQASMKVLLELNQIKDSLSQESNFEGWHTILIPTGKENNNWFRKFEYKLKQYILDIKWIGLLNFLNFETAEIHFREISKNTWLQVGRGSVEREKLLLRIRMIGLWVLVPVLILGSFLSALFLGKVLKPINALISTIRRIDKGEIEARAVVSGTEDEIDELSMQFNSLMESNANLLRSVGQTLDNIAHDIRTPITRFRISAELGLKDLNDSNRQREALSEGIESAVMIDSLLTAILDAAEAETETMDLSVSALSVDNLIHQIVDLYNYVLEEKEIKLVLQIETTGLILGDETRLKQAFGNLIDNAIKYSSVGGTIKIVTRDTEDQVIIEITDFGIGISETDLPKIWERLFRAEAGRNSPGLGIGLSIVRAIIKAHGGEIQVVSKYGEGSSFLVSFSRVK